MHEIERKFLVESDSFKTEAFRRSHIKQGFLNVDPDRTVRVRLKDGQADITVKGRSSEDGLVRFEWETDISRDDAEKLLNLCHPGLIEKVRYDVKAGDHIIEIDVFAGENEGLVLAEIELINRNEEFSRPEWLGEEVTGLIKYYNANLSKNPFKSWER